MPLKDWEFRTSRRLRRREGGVQVGGHPKLERGGEYGSLGGGWLGAMFVKPTIPARKTEVDRAGGCRTDSGAV